jgi:DNA-binding NarL/FixJ family response regulator
LLRQALRTVLAAQPDIGTIVEASDGKEAVELAERTRPDVVVMDSQMAIVSGVEATGMIKRRNRNVKVLLLTLGVDEELVMEMLRAGASGCLMKDADVGELVNAVRVAAKGGSYLSPEIEERLVRTYVTRSGRIEQPRRQRDQLSVREREVLQLTAEGHRQLGDRAEACAVGQDGRGAQVEHLPQAGAPRQRRPDQIRDPQGADRPRGRASEGAYRCRSLTSPAFLRNVEASSK